MNRRVPPPEEEVGWQKELDELAERKRIAQEMGGKARVERQHAGGRRHPRIPGDPGRDHGRLRRRRPPARRGPRDLPGAGRGRPGC